MLASVTFSVIAVKESTLRLTNVILSDNNGNPLAVRARNGTITIVEAAPKWDANQDGQVNVLDLVLVAKSLGTRNARADASGDGTVNVLDLVIVTRHLGESTGATQPDTNVWMDVDISTGLPELTPETVIIPDPNLRAAIEEELGKVQGATITKTDMLRLTRLYAGERSIQDLTGLELATNLSSLSLNGNRINSNISPLAGLTKLTYLQLHYHQLSDISPLAGLKNLRHLSLISNQITDISSLAGLTNLTYLDLKYNQITDISPLAGLTKLDSLALHRNQITDISPLAGLTKLDSLHLYDNQITDISPLAGLTKLDSLGLNGNRITDISPLAGLTKLTTLGLSNNQISDFSPIAGLIPNLRGYFNNNQTVPKDVSVHIPDLNLRAIIEDALSKAQGAAITPAEMQTLTELSAEERGIQDLTGIEFATNLTELYLRGNELVDVSPLAGLTNLTNLSLRGNELVDVSPLAGLTNLTTLRLDTNQLVDVSPLTGLANLKWLRLHRNQLVDVSPLAELTNLTNLFLSFNEISDVSPLAGLTNLKWLFLSYNELVDVSLLAGLTNLTALYLDNNELVDVSPLAGLTNLTWLYLDNNELVDISPLAGLTNLTNLSLIDNQIPDFSAIAGLIPNLESYRNSDQRESPLGDATDGPVNIPDPNLRAAIEEALGKTKSATITSAEMSTLTRLSAKERDIQDLTGLEFATNLTALDLDNNKIVDISPLAKLTNLTTLYLSYNRITNISPLAKLTNLTGLNLHANEIVDISPLAGLTNLTDLGLDNNRITDISPFAKLTNLTTLYLSYNLITDISPFAKLTNLTILYLDNNRITDISSVAKLTNLTQLDLSDNKITDISPLAKLTNLTTLYLGYNLITDFSPIAGVVGNLEIYRNNDQGNPNVSFYILDANLRTVIEKALGKTKGATIPPADMLKLTELDGSDSGIANLTGLEFATNLTTLDLSGNKITDISPLAKLTNLTMLVLDNNLITDFSPIAGVVGNLRVYTNNDQGDPNAPLRIPDFNLRSIIEKKLHKTKGATITQADMLKLTELTHFDDLGIEDLTGLEFATNLTDLWLNNNEIVDISPLARLTNLATLGLDNNRITDISALARLTNLIQLHLTENQISDISSLAKLTNLTDLDLDNTRITDISPLARLTNLTTLYLRENRISDISPLAKLTNLTTLYLDRNQISDILPISKLTNLTDLNLGWNRISDISPLAKLTNLTTLYLHYNLITDFSSIAGVVGNLQNYANNDQINPNAPLHILDPDLRTVIEKALGKTKGASITPADMLKLTELDGSDSGIANLTGLEFATNLTTLDLSNNQIRHISSVAKLTNLTTLYLHNNLITDFSPIAGVVGNLRVYTNNDQVDPNVPLHILDANLRTVIEKALGKTKGATITRGDMLNLTELNDPDSGIEDLTGLEFAKNITQLDLSGNAITDISALTQLTNLTGLNLSRNEMADISPIARLISLAWLDLSDNTITDISALAQLTKLIWLDLSGDRSGGNAITDISPVAQLTNLTGLDLSDNTITDISPLAQLTKLTELDLSSNAITDISPVAQLTNLTRLWLWSNQISDISPIAKLTKLTGLRLWSNQISDISPVAQLTKLEWLDLSSNAITDISPLARLINLTNLDIGFNEIVDISPLIGLRKLNYLRIYANPIWDFSVLSHLSNLQTLHFIARLLESSTEIRSFLMSVSVTYDIDMPDPDATLQPATHVHSIKRKTVSGGVNAYESGGVRFAPFNDPEFGTLNWTHKWTEVSESLGDPTTITVKFLNGIKGDIDIVKEAARLWEDEGHLKFKFLEPNEAGASDIRVKFKYDYYKEFKYVVREIGGEVQTTSTPTGRSFNEAEAKSYQPPSPPSETEYYGLVAEVTCWSKVGVGAVHFKDEETILFVPGFSLGTALHEFGHALGLLHEHSSPKFKDYFEWKDEQELIDSFMKSNLWTREKAEKNLVKIFPVAEHLPGVFFDPESVMTYAIPSTFLVARPNAPEWAIVIANFTGISTNDQLSAGDKAIMKILYPEPIPLTLEASISVYAKDEDFFGNDWFDNRNDPTEVHYNYTDYNASLSEYLSLGKEVFVWGDKECRVEVHMSVKNVGFEGGERYAEVGIFALLYEDEAGTRGSDDLEDIVCETVRIPFGSTSTPVKLDLLKNRSGVFEIKFGDKGCPGLYEHNELYLGDASGGGDWAEVSVDIRVYEPIIAVSLAPSHLAHQSVSSVDVNGDGQVDAEDLSLVSNYLDQPAPEIPPVDVNNDGVVTIADLVQVAQYLGQSTTSPAPVHVAVPVGLRYETVEGWIDQARVEDDGSLVFYQGIAKLEYLLILIIPEETALLHNYPNPFNPETWIPYHLSQPADVVLTIYSIDGKVVSRLDLGHQAAGYYQDKSRAAHWDGRNAIGERVASGVYFYTFTAGDFAATRKMLIMK